jgi:restriction system protein
MGHIIMPASAFAVALSEDAGERSGFALSAKQLVRHLREEHPFRASLADDDQMLRIGSDVYEDTVGDLMYALGAANQPGMPTLARRLMERLGSSWRSQIDIMSLLEVEAVANHYLRRRSETGVLDRDALNADLDQVIGERRRAIMDELLDAMSFHLAQCPWFTRTKYARDLTTLSTLFESEALPLPDDGFFDQRFINYLIAKPDLLQEINWRQFEGLSAEWLSRSGYEVKLGAGRNDGGIDVRAWKEGAAPGTPPAIIVQCKREKRKVGKVVVKALWADAHSEGAEAGLIVTTNDISPGAAKVVEARAYPITVANRQEVQRWLRAMRSPEAGVVL